MVTIHGASTDGFEGNLADPGCTGPDAKILLPLFCNCLTQSIALRIHQIDNGAYTDQPEPLISIGGSASLAAFAAATHTSIPDARRFRLNIILATDVPLLQKINGAAPNCSMGDGRYRNY